MRLAACDVEFYKDRAETLAFIIYVNYLDMGVGGKISQFADEIRIGRVS